MRKRVQRKFTSSEARSQDCATLSYNEIEESGFKLTLKFPFV